MDRLPSTATSGGTLRFHLQRCMLNMVGSTHDNSIPNPGQCLDGEEATTRTSRELLPFTGIPQMWQVCRRQLVARSIFEFLLGPKTMLLLVVVI
jgi:hypothetical protein